ncbi:MAG: hypothetical protein A2Y33_07360 [Spirochaetes bacterium GWF1_51_8]|nr:MAG: hypothetical protein A2Y33_07360 [Spirochaetes bacterium GWF1_51_8]
MKKLIVILAVFAAVTGCNTPPVPTQFDKAKAELNMLMNDVIQLHERSIKMISESSNFDDIAIAIKITSDTKMGIGSEIDRIAQTYPNLNQQEIEKMYAFMGEKGKELDAVSARFVQAIDDLIRANLNDQAKTQPLIIALKQYQMIGQ